MRSVCKRDHIQLNNNQFLIMEMGSDQLHVYPRGIHLNMCSTVDQMMQSISFTKYKRDQRKFLNDSTIRLLIDNQQKELPRGNSF